MTHQFPGVHFPVPYDAAGNVIWPDADPTSPFFITGPALISFSGGRTSAFMLFQILWAHGGVLPANVYVTFANTGKEDEKTLRFVHECSVRWSVRIWWLEWRTRRVKDDDGNAIPFDQRYDVVGFNSASRKGEPFERLIAAKGYTPNAVTRFCTSELKVRVMKHFMLAQGYQHWVNVVGLRFDEPRRILKAMAANLAGKERWQTALPLVTAEIIKRAIMRFWFGKPVIDLSIPPELLPQGFDLGLLEYEGNCDGCFLKAYAKLIRIEREKPGTLDWWARQEIVGKGRFVTEYSMAQVAATARDQGVLPGIMDDDEDDHDAECGLICGNYSEPDREAEEA